MQFFVKDTSGRGYSALLDEIEVLAFKEEAEESFDDITMIFEDHEICGELENKSYFVDWINNSSIGDKLEFNRIEITRIK